MRMILAAAVLLLTAGLAVAQPPRPPADMLAERVAALEARVTALEQRAGTPQAASSFTTAPQAAPWPAPAYAATGAVYGPAFGYPAAFQGGPAAYGAFGDDAGACANGSCGAASEGRSRGLFRGGLFRRGR